MIIRLAVETDFERWRPLWEGYQNFYKVNIHEATTALTWARFLDATEPMHCAVAVIDNELIGLVHYIHHRSCWTPGDYVYLQDLFVDKRTRGQGVGRALIEFVYAKAKVAGASRVWWLTQQSNAEAMLLYDRIADKSGFIQYRKIF